MNKMQEWLFRASNELGLRAEFNYLVKLGDGSTLTARAYFPHLSNSKGVLIFDWSDKVDASARQELESMGMGMTTFGEPGPNEEFDIGSYIQMFAEWGWTGPEAQKPRWIP